MNRIKSCLAMLGLTLLYACQSGDGKIKSATDSTAAGSDSGSKAALEPIFADHMFQLTGVAKEQGGRLLVNYPRWSEIYRYAVAEVTGDSTARPYPSDTMNQWVPGEPGQNTWVCVQSVYFDDDGQLWVLDPAAPMLKTVQGGGAKLVKMNNATGRPERSYSFNGIVPDTAYVNDLRVDVRRQFAYVTESKGGGIVVIDLNTGRMRRVLSNHYSVKSDPAFRFIIDGRELMKDGRPAKFNSDGIALSPDGAWIYYKPLTDDKLYRIQTAYLRDWNLPDSALGNRVEDLGRFTTTDGMIFDKQGNLYLGDLQNYRIVRIDKNHKMTVVVEDQRLLWPDSYAIADGYLHISCSQIHKQPEYNNGENKRTSPYMVYRLRL
ncbi:MAG TPA: L-dopachrome tautomerase-related protein [Flavisolibacter sp.]|nr:L-dopachrome tautomerase-related protein [Flavisolibacter sp.]